MLLFQLTFLQIYTKKNIVKHLTKQSPKLYRRLNNSIISCSSFSRHVTLATAYKTVIIGIKHFTMPPCLSDQIKKWKDLNNATWWVEFKSQGKESASVPRKPDGNRLGYLSKINNLTIVLVKMKKTQTPSYDIMLLLSDITLNSYRKFMTSFFPRLLQFFSSLVLQ